MCFLKRMLKISWAEKKSNQHIHLQLFVTAIYSKRMYNEEVLKMAGVGRHLLETLRKWQQEFTERVTSGNGQEKLVASGKTEGRRARGRQTMKYLDSLYRYLLAEQHHSVGADQGN